MMLDIGLARANRQSLARTMFDGQKCLTDAITLITLTRKEHILIVMFVMNGLNLAISRHGWKSKIGKEGIWIRIF